MYWSRRLPPGWLPSSCSWTSGGRREDWRRCEEVWGVMSLQCEPTQRRRRGWWHGPVGGCCCWHRVDWLMTIEIFEGCVSSQFQTCPAPLPPFQNTTARRLSSWPPRGASSCWAAPRAPTRSWSRSLHRTPTRRCLWGWCTGCCLTTSRWPGAVQSPSPSPEHGLQTQKKQTNEAMRKI